MLTKDVIVVYPRCGPGLTPHDIPGESKPKPLFLIFVYTSVVVCLVFASLGNQIRNCNIKFGNEEIPIYGYRKCDSLISSTQSVDATKILNAAM